MKKAGKTIPKKSVVRDQNTIILEDLVDQFRAFGEGMEVFSDGQKRLEEKVDRIDVRLINVENKVVEIDHRLIDVEDRLINVETKVEEIDERLIHVETKVVEIDERLIRVEDDVVEIKHKLSEKVDREEFQKLEKRLIKLEKLVLARR